MSMTIQKFPARPMAASSNPFYFKEEPAEAMVQALFEQQTAIRDLDDFLEQDSNPGLHRHSE